MWRIVLIACVFGCQGEPDTLCDRESIRWSLEGVSVSPSQDVSPKPGLQVDIVVRTSLSPGLSMQLFVGARGDEEPTPGPEVLVDETGTLVFQSVTLPEGALSLSVVGNNECRRIRSSRPLFVFDEAGDFACSFTPPGLLEDGVRQLSAMDDGEPGTPGLQTSFVVDTLRPAIDVEVLALSAGVEQSFTGVSDENGSVTFPVTLDEGSHAVRAICRWDAVSVPRLSATHQLAVSSSP